MSATPKLTDKAGKPAGVPGEQSAGAGSQKRRLVRPAVLVATTAVVLLSALTLAALRLSRPFGESGQAGAPPDSSAPAARALRSGPRPPTAPEVDSRIFEVTEATGRVEALRDGKWTMIVAGDVLTQDAVVRTGVGRAILRRGAAEIELRDRVEIRLDSISRAGASLDLRRGRVVANVGRAGGSVAITAARTRTANEGQAPARFVVTADGRGRVSVATTEGAARFEAAGRAVKVEAGKTTRAEPGKQPRDPEKISEDIFLSVSWPVGHRREDKVPVSGRTDRNTLVRINGAEATVDDNGNFAASVPVRVGANAVEVEAEDVSGRIKRARGEIQKIPTKPPELAPVPTELWKQ